MPETARVHPFFAANPNVKHGGMGRMVDLLKSKPNQPVHFDDLEAAFYGDLPRPAESTATITASINRIRHIQDLGGAVHRVPQSRSWQFVPGDTPPPPRPRTDQYSPKFTTKANTAGGKRDIMNLARRPRGGVLWPPLEGFAMLSPPDAMARSSAETHKMMAIYSEKGTIEYLRTRPLALRAILEDLIYRR